MGGDKGLRGGEIGLGGRPPCNDPGALALLLLLLLIATPPPTMVLVLGTAVAPVGAEAAVSTSGGGERRACGGLLSFVCPPFFASFLNPIKPKDRSRAANSFSW